MGSPLRGDDLATFRAHAEPPLQVSLRAGTLYNVAPPTQGFATLMALAIFDRVGVTAAEVDSFAHLHGLIEATKIAYRLRNRPSGRSGRHDRGRPILAGGRMAR